MENAKMNNKQYLFSLDALKTVCQGAIGAMTFGMYHMYVTDAKIKINNEKNDENNRLNKERVDESIRLNKERVDESIRLNRERLDESIRFNNESHNLKKEIAELREQIKQKRWW